MEKKDRRPLVAISGGAGLVGTALIRELSPEYRVVALDVKKPENLDPDDGGLDWIECDLTDQRATETAFEALRKRHGRRITSFVHLAAYYDFSGEPSPLYEELTVQGTRRVLGVLKGSDFDCEQFVFSSSLLVMKAASEGEVLTEMSPLEAEWDYPESKRAAESAIVNERDAIPTVILRVAGVYDEQCHSLPIAQQIRRIFEKMPESHFFPGNRSHGQPFLHLDDLVSCVRKVIERRNQLTGLEVFLVGEPEIESYGELQEQLGTLIHGSEWATVRIPKPVAKAGAWVKNQVQDDDEVFIKPWMVDLADAHYPISIAHAENELGWHPTRRLRDTLPKMVGRLLLNPKRWYEENGLPFPDDLEATERQEAGAGNS